jgi:hypothetical protein
VIAEFVSNHELRSEATSSSVGAISSDSQIVMLCIELDENIVSDSVGFINVAKCFLVIVRGTCMSAAVMNESV